MHTAVILYDVQAEVWAYVAELFRAHRAEQDPERRHEIEQAEAAKLENARIERRAEDLMILYPDSFAWREDRNALRQYAVEHRDALLQRQTEITAAHVTFHEDHRLVMYLRDFRLCIYHRTDEVFFYHALALALQPLALSPEQYDAPVAAVVQRYNIPEFAWREVPDDVARYAARHGRELLAPHRRERILAEHARFEENRAFIEHLKAVCPSAYARSDAVFYLRALALAERLSAQEEAPLPKPPKPPTPEEHRARKLRRKQIAFDDLAADLAFDCQAIQTLRDKQQALGLDDDQFDQLLRRYHIIQRALSERRARKDHAHDDDEAEIY